MYMSKLWLRLAFWCVCTAALCGVGFAAGHFVAPDGTPQGDGTAERPWDLATALRPHPAIRPMDTVWLRKGLYRGNFQSRLKGAPNAPVILRAYPRERAVLDGAENSRDTVLTVNGAWTWIWGLEIMNSNPVRSTSLPGPDTAGTRGTGLAVKAANVKVINSVIHDTGTGITFFRDAPDGEIYGTILFNTGWRAPDRPHGPSIYTQNKDGWKSIRDNVFFNSMRHNMQLYGSSQTFLDNYLIQGNVNFNGRWLTGGAGPMKHIRFEENMFYGNTAEFGYINRSNENLFARLNYLPVAVSILGWDRIEWRDNTVFRPENAASAVRIEFHAPASLTNSIVERNQYLVRDMNQAIASVVVVAEDQSKQTVQYPLTRWRSDLNFDLGGGILVLPGGRPQEPKVFVRRNHYEPDRAHVVIYNWTQQDEVEIDIPAMAPANGDRWTLRNVQNLFVEEMSGTYEGKPIRVPMKKWTAASPIGEELPVQPATFPEFGVFILTLERVKPATARSGAAFLVREGAPGSILLAEIPGLGAESAVAGSVDGETTLAGISVHLRDCSGQEAWARLLSTSPDSLAFVAPGDFAIGPMTITVQTNEGPLDGGSVFLQEVAPALFTMDGLDKGPAVGYAHSGQDEHPRALSACDGAKCYTVPVPAGGTDQGPILTLFGTAFRRYQPGMAASAFLYSRPAELVSIAADEAYPGLDLIRIRIPPAIPDRGPLPLRVTIGHFASNTVTIAVE